MKMSKVRNAVGAIIVQGNECLLIHKVKVMDEEKGPYAIEGTWDFPKGGVTPSDNSLEEAILRELKEETGSQNYKIIKQIEQTINFNFPKGCKYDEQITTMFYVAYRGDRSDLEPQDEEIDEIKFVDYQEVEEILGLEETKEFFRQHKNGLIQRG